ncbi:MAG: class I SAM-dependent methyltransferase [Burkholderiales bacterium]|nr:class I SAM-dependent methyltransferase [Flavobacterium sp.]
MDKNKIAVALFDKLAIRYQQKYMDVNLYANTLDFFCNHLKKNNAEVLELACGPGNITQYVLKRRPDFRVLGTDLSERMLALAKINNPNADFQILDCRALASVQKKYDAVICGFCCPYLSKQEITTLISDTCKSLKSRGLLYLSTIEGDHAKSGFKKGSTGEEIFMHYYQADYLVTILEKNGFKVINLVRKTYQIHDEEATDLIIISQLNS